MKDPNVAFTTLHIELPPFDEDPPGPQPTGSDVPMTRREVYSFLVLVSFGFLWLNYWEVAEPLTCAGVSLCIISANRYLSWKLTKPEPSK